jgi:hypothetical protein
MRGAYYPQHDAALTQRSQENPAWLGERWIAGVVVGKV